jgi:hypothetical protein
LKVGQIYLEKASVAGARQFQSLIEGLDKLGIEQHVLVASAELARSLSSLPYVTVGPVVSTPVVACCLMPDVDIAHVHDGKSGQSGLLLTLTRSIPYVITLVDPGQKVRNPITRSIRNRAQQTIKPEGVQPEALVDAYQVAAAMLLKRPKNPNCW